jgi:hypothetical protein
MENNNFAPTPFHQVYHMSPDVTYLTIEEKERQKLNDMYPEVARRIQEHVEEVCDKMEYDGSLMFDETPDRLMLRHICISIYERVKEYYDMEEEVLETDEMLAMNFVPRRRRRQNNFVENIIEVMLFNEIYRRRCRRRNCYRRYW